MGWSADWRIPHARTTEAQLRAVLEACVAARGHRLAYLGAQGSHGIHAGIAIASTPFVGCLEWSTAEPTPLVETRYTLAAVEELAAIDDRELDDDGYPRDERLFPRSLLALANASRGAVDVLGTGRGILTLDAFVDRASRITRLLPADAYEAELVDDRAGLCGVATRGDERWYHGGPALVVAGRAGRWQAIETGIPPEHAIIALHPDLRGGAIAVTDDGAVWRTNGAGQASRVDEIPPPAYYNHGYWNIHAALATRGDELWIANDGPRAHCLDGRGVRAVELSPGSDDEVRHVVCGSDARVWLASEHQLRVVDEAALGVVDLAGEILSLAAGRGGAIHVLVAREAAVQLITLDGGAVRELPLEVEGRSLSSLTAATGEVLWAIADEASVVRIELPLAAGTHMTLRSNRDDNREDAVWHAMCDLGSEVAAALDGWDVTAP